MATDVDIRSYLKERVRANPGEALKVGLRLSARSFDTIGFAAFYELIMGLELPNHAHIWVKELFHAHSIDKGLVNEAFRGSTKTTIQNIFIAFLIGHMPHKGYLLIQVSDDIATDNTLMITDIIANNPEWKAVFGHVVPDRDVRWGAGGYEVKDTRYDYPAWRKLLGSSEGKGKDPTLIGLGYKSRAVIGKHPTGGLFVDDIHDENNTSSERELKGVIKRLTGTIFPTMVPGAFKMFTGTPWVEGDAIDYCKDTGEFICLQTPAEVDGEPVWPEKFPREELEKQKAFSGQREYARMFLLDLTKADEDGLKYYTYPHASVNTAQWPGAGGCDYASILAERRKDVKDREYFATLWGFLDTYNRNIVYDGDVEH